MVEDLSQRIAIESPHTKNKLSLVLPFYQYLNDVVIHEINERKENGLLPYPLHLQPTISKLVHSFEYSGIKEIHVFGRKIRQFGMQFDNSLIDPVYSIDHADAVYGQEFHIYQLYTTLLGLQLGRNQNRIINLVGMKGTGKSNLLRLIGKTYTAYLNQEDNQKYITEIQLPFDITKTKRENSLGFHADGKDKDGSIHDGKYSYHFRCNDSPIFLIPKEIRKKYLEKIGVDITSIPPYILESEMCSSCQTLQDLVFRFFEERSDTFPLEKNDLETFFEFFTKYVFAVKHRIRNGREVTMFEVNTQKSPDILRFNLQPEYIGNGNVPVYPLNNMPLATSELMLFDDLRAFERYWEDVRSIVSSGVYKPFENLWMSKDSVIIVASNEEIDNVEPFKHDTGLIDRIIKVPLPSILRYGEEIQVYSRNINKLKEQYELDPNITKLVNMFAVAGRVNVPRTENIEKLSKRKLQDHELKAINSLTSLEKVLLYNGDEEDFEIFPKLANKAIFSDNLVAAIHRDYYEVDDLLSMEGFKGPSVRGIQDLYTYLADWCLTRRELDKPIIMGFDLIESLGNFPTNLMIKWFPEWNRASSNPRNDAERNGYGHPPTIVKLLKNFYHNLLEKQVIFSTVELSEDSFFYTAEKYLDLLKEWVTNDQKPDVKTKQNKYAFGNENVTINWMLANIEKEQFDQKEALTEQSYIVDSVVQNFRGKVLRYARENGDERTKLHLRTFIADKIVNDKKSKEYNTTLENINPYIEKFFSGEIPAPTKAIVASTNGSDIDDYRDIFYRTTRNMIKNFKYSDITSAFALEYYINKRLRKEL